MAPSVYHIYQHLLRFFGPQHWWPVDARYHQKNKSDPRVEILIGAILTQNTAWKNVEKALENLRIHDALTIKALVTVDNTDLKKWIQPSGFFNQKANRLKLFATYLYKNYEANIERFFCRDTKQIRQELLTLPGIGPETADSMLLYAGNHPVFVVDAYTKRICKRIPMPVQNDSYDDIQRFFEKSLKNKTPAKELPLVYNELHALIVKQAKEYCKKTPNCADCPLSCSCEKVF